MAETKNVIGTLGRRKTSVARVYTTPGTGQIIINDRKLEEYFPVEILQTIVKQPLTVIGQVDKFDIKVNVKGGGFKGQAEAIRLGISRAMVYQGKNVQKDNVITHPEADRYAALVDAIENRKKLKKEGFLTRDPRMVERKKYGRRKARRRFQFSKR